MEVVEPLNLADSQMQAIVRFVRRGEWEQFDHPLWNVEWQIALARIPVYPELRSIEHLNF